jgi:putative spermidine/putrescine transport system ATP-binding protein
MTAFLQIQRLRKTYDDVVAIDQVSLDVRKGEFMTFLGPSGSGKSTTLYIVAGFQEPSEGRVLLDGKPLLSVAPNKRNIGMVFQRYTLFPHLTVGENIAFPLRVRRLPDAEVKAKVEQMLKLVHLSECRDRMPAQLSGGQQQRVAIARALAYDPPVLLMDEPLSALDKKLREEIQLELRRIHQETGVTILYVTHDQEEALRLSDRIAVFNKGRIEQVDTPRNLYMKPATTFVAEFVGTSNVIRGDLAKQLSGNPQPFSIRPEHVRFAEGPLASHEIEVSGLLHDIQYQGSATRYELKLENGQTLNISQANNQWIDSSAQHQTGQRLSARWAREAMVQLHDTVAGGV